LIQFNQRDSCDDSRIGESGAEELKAKDQTGDEATYSGVLVAEVLKKAAVSMGKRLSH
jgi:hypothetical protein